MAHARTYRDIGDTQYLAMFEHALDHNDRCRVLIGGRGGTISLSSIRRVLSDLVRAEPIASAEKSLTGAIPHELIRLK